MHVILANDILPMNVCNCLDFSADFSPSGRNPHQDPGYHLVAGVKPAGETKGKGT